MLWKVVQVLIVVVVVLFALIQVIPVARTNPPIIREPVWHSPHTRAYAERACFDCHSNETTWPWYAYVAPISWRVVDHVNKARTKFNVSNWTPGDGKDAAEDVEHNAMPLRDYLWMHPEARLSAAEKAEFIVGLRLTFGAAALGTPETMASLDADEVNETATADLATCAIRVSALNLRAGPGLEYDPPIGVLPVNIQVQPIARNSNGNWLEIERLDNEQRGWISAQPGFVACKNDILSLPISDAYSQP